MFRTLAPPRDLEPYVRFFWMLQAHGAEPATERVIPDGCCELIWQLEDSFERLVRVDVFARQPSAFVFGQIERAIELRSRRRVDVLGVRLAPAGTAALWGLDASMLGAREHSLADLFPASKCPSIDELRDLCAPPHSGPQRHERRFAARCEHISRWLRGRVRRTERRDVRRAAAAIACIDAGFVRLADISRETGFSRRSVERAFRSAVGLSPASYVRLRRVAACSRELREGKETLSAVAALAGYADQAHFSREFRSIVGVSPAGYRRRLGMYPPLVP